MDEMGQKILSYARTELYLSMHFMGDALGSLSFVMDLSTRTIGTDAVSIRFNPSWLRELFLTRQQMLNRTYIHMLMHCLFRHMYAARDFEDADLFDLCADIAVESVIDTMEYPAIARLYSQLREEWYEKLTQKVHILTAQKLYRYFQENPLGEEEEKRLRREFCLCDHRFWERAGQEENSTKNPPGMQVPPLQARIRKATKEEWKRRAGKALTELSLGKEAGQTSGSLVRTLSFETQERTDYRQFLKRFAVIREEASVDPDSFDYGLYQYGLSLYGDLPLIEENELREVRRIDQLVIAIDTSASCERSLVQKFLNETVRILRGQDTFFHKVEIHLVECDEKVQRDLVLHDTEDIERYAESFEIRGGFGTDFRPVFDYVDELQKKGTLTSLRGLMYFTDGFGTYPVKAPPYETAFVFRSDEEWNDKDVPGWALKLFL